MKFPYLNVENFMGIGAATVDLADKGLVLIQGVNEDDTSQNSNGAGKSSVADALAWVLYGITRKGLSADEVVNTNAGKNTHVTVHAVEEDGSFYVIERWRKKAHKGKRAGCGIEYHAQDGTVTDLTGGTDKLTQAQIDRAIGAPEDVFLAAIYSAQEALPNLPAMTDSELKRLIEEASGITTLVRAYEIARQRLKDTEREQDIWRADHGRLEADIRSVQTRLDDLTLREQGWEAKRKTEIESMSVDLRQAVERSKRAKTKRDSVDPENVNKVIAALDDKISAVHSEQERESELNAAWSEDRAKLTTAEVTDRQLTTNAQNLKADLDRITERVGEPCSTCGKPYAEHDIEGAKSIAVEKLRLEVTRAKEHRLDLQALRTAEQASKSALDAFRASRTNIQATVEERRRLALLLVDRSNAERDFDREVADARRIGEAIKAKQVEVNPFGPLMEAARNELGDHMKAHRSSEERGVELERGVQVAKTVVKLYGPAGVRAHVLDTVTPFLNSRTSDYLSAMSDGNITAIWSTIQLNAKGDPTEKFAIDVNKPGYASSFAGLSGGEKRKVRLACALALQDLVASRATKPLDLWIGDEIDDALDVAGLERLMNVLVNKARERGTVAVISHNELQDWIPVTATVTMKGGQATIDGALDYVPLRAAA